MLTFLIIVAVILAGVVAWRMRVQLLAKVLGQSESRIDRQLNRKKRPRLNRQATPLQSTASA